MRRPAISKTVRQPPGPIKAAVSSPAELLPTAKPMKTDITATPRRCAGMTSLARAMQLGSAPPKPMPVRRRKATNWFAVSAKAVSASNKPNASTEAITTGRCPNRSGSRDTKNNPMDCPTSPAEKTGPNSRGPN